MVYSATKVKEMKLTVVFPDHRIQSEYANGHVSSVDFYTDHGTGIFFGNTTTKTAFTDAVTNAGHNMNDYWAIQYSGGEYNVEYANGYPSQTVSGNTGLSEYISLVNTWRSTIDEEIDEEIRISQIPTWDQIRERRDDKITKSDKIIAWSTETGNAVPADWTTYRQDLRDITTTYGAPSGNTELVVFPSEPSWPSA